MDGFLESLPSPALWQEFIERTCFSSFFLSFLFSLFSSFLFFASLLLSFRYRLSSFHSGSIEFDSKGNSLNLNLFFRATEELGIVARFVVNDYAAFWCDRTILRMNITFDIAQMLVWRIWKLPTSSWKLVCTEILVCTFWNNYDVQFQ